ALGGGDLRRRAPTGLPSSPRDPRPGPRVGARAVALLARPPPLRPHASPGRPARGRRMTIRGLTQDVSCALSAVPPNQNAPWRPCPRTNDAAPAKCSRDSDRKSTRLNSSHVAISYAVFCLKKKNISDYT